MPRYFAPISKMKIQLSQEEIEGIISGWARDLGYVVLGANVYKAMGIIHVKRPSNLEHHVLVEPLDPPSDPVPVIQIP